MKVNAAILKRGLYGAQQCIVLRGDGLTRFARQLGLEALGEAVDEAFELAHLCDEGVAAL